MYFMAIFSYLFKKYDRINIVSLRYNLTTILITFHSKVQPYCLFCVFIMHELEQNTCINIYCYMLAE